MILRILFDQNIPPVVCEFVRKRKPHWEVRHINDVGLHGATDDTIFQWAQSDLSIVVTFDEDFADARMYPAGSHAGVIRLRVWRPRSIARKQRWRVCSTPSPTTICPVVS